jgi:hypothetical protein
MGGKDGVTTVECEHFVRLHCKHIETFLGETRCTLQVGKDLFALVAHADKVVGGGGAATLEIREEIVATFQLYMPSIPLRHCIGSGRMASSSPRRRRRRRRRHHVASTFYDAMKFRLASRLDSPSK